LLLSLYIRDYALIEELDVEFGSGLNIITGETGAGKSILIGALKMILGERASTEVVRSGAKKAVIEGVFDEADTPAIRSLLEENGIEVGPRIILRREITDSYSRAFINDTPATLSVMREAASHLIDLHGQHEHQSLLRTETHIQLLDSFGGLAPLRDRYRKAYDAVDVLMRERKRLLAREREILQQKELFGFQIDEIDRVKPAVGEDDDLEAEHRVLENAETLFETTARLYQLLYESDGAIQDQIVHVCNELQDLTNIDAEFSESLKEVESARIIVSETAKFLRNYNARIEFNPERLEEIRVRLGELERLKRKYGGSIETVLTHRMEIGATYELAVDFEGAIERLNRQIEEARTVLSGAAEDLTRERKEVASHIEASIVAECGRLGMPDCQFEVRFSHQLDEEGWIAIAPAGRFAAFDNGMDLIEFYISTNVGEVPRPLARIASGGEISRIMLALKTILARSERLPILVFDEIDTGISGGVARKVGQSMHELAQFHQVVAITHLPQIAALGDIHFLVEKFVVDGRTKTLIRRLDGDGRAAHVATLISGAGVTDAALESARELINGRRP
jgi:DNA repair protein RecN (Recombination protein N)